MSSTRILSAIDEENLGSVRRWLNSNTGRENLNKIMNSGQTVLNAALKVEATYTSPNTFAARIVKLLKEHGAKTAEELQTPQLNIFAGFNYQEPNIFNTPVAGEVSTTDIFTGKPPLPPRRNQNKPSRKLNGIAFGPKRNKRNSRKRRSTRRI